MSAARRTPVRPKPAPAAPAAPSGAAEVAGGHRPLVCCRAFTDDITVSQRAEFAWQALHELAHGRVPFSVERLAELARVEGDAAGALIELARFHRWVTSIGTAGLFVGALPRKR
jgi:hypothetical protein